MSYVATDLFGLSEIEIIRGEVRAIDKRTDNVSRGLFARHNDLSERFSQLKEHFDRLSEVVNRIIEMQKSLS